MRHYVLTRSAYGPDWTPEANLRRLAITRAVTVPLMAAQTDRDWTWVVMLDPRDPFRAERQAAFASAAPELRVIWWASASEGPSTVAFEAYRGPWEEAIGPRDDLILQTRLDDDDGLAPHSIARQHLYQRAVIGRKGILMQPRGVRVWDGRYSVVRHTKNAMHTLVTKPGTDISVYEYGHTRCDRMAPVFFIDNKPGWLWVRHRDTLSTWRIADKPLNGRIRDLFPVDWPVLEAAWS